MSATDVLDAYDKAAAWDDLYHRLEEAERQVGSLALEQTSTEERLRLIGKGQGIALALSYMRGY